MEQELDSYMDACYWDFVFMVRDPTWPVQNTMARLARRARVLRSHLEAGKDEDEKRHMTEVVEVAWVDFCETIVKGHLPDRMSSVQDLYDAHYMDDMVP